MATKLPVGRLCVSILLAVTVSSAVSYAVCVATDNVAAMSATLVVTLAATVVPIMRWWLKAARAAGVPKTAITPSRLRTAVTALIAIAVSMFLEVAAFDATHRYVIEALVALAGTAVVATITAKSIGSMPNGNAPSADLMRLSAIVSALSVFIFGANLWLQITAHPHSYALGSVYHAYLIAGFFLIVPMNAVNAYRYWRRWKSSHTPGATPTFT